MSCHAIACAVIIIGILLRLYGVGSDFHHDEVFSVQAASGSFSHLIQTTVWDRSHSPLYGVLLYSWINIFGNSELSARMLSILASSFFLFVLYRMALRLVPDWASLFVVLICAVSPFLVRYGQMARPYALASLLAVLTVYLFLKTQDASYTRVCKLLYGLACSLLVYTHYMGVLILVPQFAALILSRKAEDRSLLFYGLAGVLLILPWILLMGENLNSARLEERIGWLDKPSVLDGLGFYAQVFGRLPAGNTVLIVLLSALVMSSIIMKRRSLDWTQLLFFSSLTLIGPVAAFLISHFAPISIWAPRQMIGSAIFFICLIGIGIGFHRRWVGIVLGAAVVAWCCVTLPAEFKKNINTPWRFIVHTLQQKCADCDVVVQRGWGIPLSLNYYYKKEIHYLNDYSRNLGKTSRLAFICRPIDCHDIDMKEIKSRYMQTEIQIIDWGNVPSPYKTIRIHFFKRL